MSSEGKLVGRIRDRVVPLGVRAASPLDVDSLDEVLLLVRRKDLLESPLSEDPSLAWHAYGVEYSARVRRAGKRATALDIPITHNSMTTNLANLELAHRRVGELYPDVLPIHTTCGTIRTASGFIGLAGDLLHSGRKAFIWWQESIVAVMISRHVSSGPIVLADIRFLVDRATELAGLNTVRVLDLSEPGEEMTAVSGLSRDHRPFSAATVELADINAAIESRPRNEALVLTGLTPADLALIDLPSALPLIVGLSRNAGTWVFVGAEPRDVAEFWATRRQRPFAGMLPLRGRKWARATRLRP